MPLGIYFSWLARFYFVSLQAVPALLCPLIGAVKYYLHRRIFFSVTYIGSVNSDTSN